jgi:DNA transformation protein
MSRDYCDYVVDLLSSWAKVSVKAMFGGYGMYRQGQIFAIVVDDTLYFKVGDANRPDYEAAGSSPFTYESKGKQVTMSYWRVPDEVLEDQETLSAWAEKAYRAALALR